MLTVFYHNPRLLALSIGLILVAGLSAFVLMPRMEDPLLTPRAALITTFLPGADSERVESLVTEKIEDQLKEIQQIKEVRSSSRSGVSIITVQLRDEVNLEQAASAWSRIRDKIDDARIDMPAEATKPEFEQLDAKAYALIVGLRWELKERPSYAVLRRLLKQLKDRLDLVPGTEKSEIFGDPEEEILVTIRPDAAAAMNLSPAQISRQILASDAKVPAGQLRGTSENLSLEVSGELDTLTRISHIPIQLGTDGTIVELGDIANVERTIQSPPQAQVVLQDQVAIALGVFVRPTVRLDRWTVQVDEILEDFSAQLPPGVAYELIFEQNQYVDARMQSLLANLLFGAAAIALVMFFMYGWRSALIVTTALPLCSLAVLAVMNWMAIPIHQMSISGLIIAMGLLIDNAIVAVDEVAHRIRKGMAPGEAVQEATSFLAVPLLGSTLTTVFSFGPIALMPGPSGEFVGSIAIVTIIAVLSSFVIALTIVTALAGMGLEARPKPGLWSNGLVIPPLTQAYRVALNTLFRYPRTCAAICLLPPLVGFSVAPQLAEQFFPPADRGQFHIELELPASASLAETQLVANAIRQEVLLEPEVQKVSWFIGESAPVFYYNVVPSRQNAPQYGQAIVDCNGARDTRSLIRRLQTKLNSKFPRATILVRQLEQGPPFDAPIEVRLFGPNIKVLQDLGEQLRLVLSQTPTVTHTRSELAEQRPKLTFAVDEQQARLVGLDHTAIASELNSSLEGIVGGSVLEATEELPVRVRVSSEQRADLNQILSLDLLPANQPGSGATSGYQGVPIASLSSPVLDAEISGISRLDGARMNEVQAYLEAGVLPSTALSDFEARLAASSFRLPPGYSMSYGGAKSERNEAVSSLIGNTVVLLSMMAATLVLSLGSFRLAILLFGVSAISIGFGTGALWLLDYPWGFMAVVGSMGMIGVAVNDSIVVTATMQESLAKSANLVALRERLIENARHVLATTITTIVGFAPLVTGGGDFWPPLAIVISAGVGGATLLALFFVPAAYLVLTRQPIDASTDSGAMVNQVVLNRVD